MAALGSDHFVTPASTLWQGAMDLLGSLAGLVGQGAPEVGPGPPAGL